MAKTVADIETTTTAHERTQEDLKNLLDRGRSSANIGNGSTEPGDPAGDLADRAQTATTGGGYGESIPNGGDRSGSRYGETTGLVGYDIGSGKDPQEMNAPPSAPRDLGKTEGHHEESGPETSRGKG
jgi:hypothetical protein